MSKLPLIVLLGPTAVGKTELSVELADRIGAEIISGDSMQFYRYLDIGTAKIRPAEMLARSGRLIPHHLLDIRDPDEAYSVADFQLDAAKLIEDICGRGRLPLLVGGTGLYIQALVEGFELQSGPGPDEELREELAAIPGPELLNMLAEHDPAAAADISRKSGCHDEKRLRRALEVVLLSGRSIGEQQKAVEPPYKTLLFGLQREREELYRRIDRRVELMLAAGLEQETRRACAMGFDEAAKPLQGLGYRQMGQYLAGLLTYEEAAALIKRDTRRFAKRQLTWWRRPGLREQVHWFWPGEQSQEDILALMLAELRQAEII